MTQPSLSRLVERGWASRLACRQDWAIRAHPEGAPTMSVPRIMPAAESDWKK
jgi:hypothetical protein